MLVSSTIHAKYFFVFFLLLLFLLNCSFVSFSVVFDYLNWPEQAVHASIKLQFWTYIRTLFGFCPELLRTTSNVKAIKMMKESQEIYFGDVSRRFKTYELRILGHFAFLIFLAFLGSLVPRLLAHFRVFALCLFSVKISRFRFASKNCDFTEI